ncbi:ABC transporter ATP-binding protein [Methanoplanus sp. FWC-SCC4]|uniref:Cobalamin import ATP-binding protein BtuD n=1 Tax=Methanochimaera problematica TaxID=2609417 RepID=A0AA97FAX0_9EURY|nr:ABC transporter ATP-binding protein [Methanoplanus sp. FWC-SCC4]WOF15537.1 ABC transporter ATP-binding protein [Methanoplanus sp. FWC-SCC4]
MILNVDGVEFGYKSKSVLNDIEFNVQKNELLSILGPNGVGKTTLLKCMNAILRPKAGAVMVDSDDVTKLDQLEIAKRIGYVPQKCETGRLTAFDSILLGRRPHIKWNVSEKDIKIVESAIKKLDMEDLSLRYINEMSGGELQKVSIARALVQEPRVLLLDEPTSSLDLKNQIEILRTIKEVVRGHDVSAVMTMHDLNSALRYSDKFLFLRNGTIYAAGQRDVVTPDVIMNVYGVNVDIENFKGNPVVIPVAD